MDPYLHKGVYYIPYSCNLTYIDETWRYLKVRIKEHEVAITHNRVRSSTLVDHSNKTKHRFCFENTKILVRVDHLDNLRKVRRGNEDCEREQVYQ